MSSPGTPEAKPTLPDGFIAVIKEDCPTCGLVLPALQQIHDGKIQLTIVSQDNPNFPPEFDTIVDDQSLEISWHHDIETVPTLLRIENGLEVDRTAGWSRPDWEAITGIRPLAPELPAQRPGCGSLSVDPNLRDELAVRFTGSILEGRRIEFGVLEDEMEAGFDRGWSDGLPVTPPTEARVLRMLEGTSRAPQDVVAIVPPNLVEATVEQVAINAVLAGCKPEYLPVVLAAVEASCTETFNMHGLLATTYFSGPVLVVNGPIVQRIGMNGGNNALGQGNRANMTIGRALQLVVRNLGGGRPGDHKRDGVDMGMLGSPGKLSFCFAEREADSPFTPLSVARGIEPGVDAITVFAGHGPTAIADQISRTPESLAASMASVLRTVAHPKLALAFDAMLVVSPEHGRIFSEAGWDRARLLQELEQDLLLDGDEMIRGAGGIAEGLPEAFAGSQIPKFRPGGIQVVHAGGDAGLFSAIIGGWVSGSMGSEPVTVPIGAP